jgi:hypothetical protein
MEYEKKYGITEEELTKISKKIFDERVNKLIVLILGKVEYYKSLILGEVRKASFKSRLRNKLIESAKLNSRCAYVAVIKISDNDNKLRIISRTYVCGLYTHYSGEDADIVKCVLKNLCPKLNEMKFLLSDSGDGYSLSQYLESSKKFIHKTLDLCALICLLTDIEDEIKTILHNDGFDQKIKVCDTAIKSNQFEGPAFTIKLDW